MTCLGLLERFKVCFPAYVRVLRVSLTELFEDRAHGLLPTWGLA